MPRRSVGRFVGEKIFTQIYAQSFLFRAIVIFTLCFVALVFTLHQDHQAYSAYCQAAEHAKTQGCELDKPFMERLVGDPAAFFTAVLALLTLVLATVGIAQVWFLFRADANTRVAAEAAQDAADVARDALIASQRAWIKVKISLMSDLRFEHDHATMRVLCQVTNIGTAPAKRVVIEAFLVCARKGRHFETYFDNFLDGAGFEVKNRGFVVMPNDTFPIDVFRHTHPLFLHESIAQAIDLGGMECLSLAIIGCVFYQFDTDPIRFHRTPFLYEVSRNGQAIFPDEGPVPRAEIVLSEPHYPLYVQPD